MDGGTPEQDVIFESWMFKLRSPVGKHSMRFSRSWRKRYFVLLRSNNRAELRYYERKPRTLNEDAKGTFVLYPEYQLYKRGTSRGKNYVCEITINTQRLLVAAEDEKFYHLFAFFLQTQTKLQEELEGECYVVRPETSEDQRRLGAYGTMCLLHISSGGITLALQLSKCVLAQWPLNSVKYYESPDYGKFTFEAGKHAPMGQAQYMFNTRLGQGHEIYDILDKYVMDVANLREMVSARSSTPQGAVEALVEQWSVLQSLVVAESDSRFIPHLKKISRGIYDHLAEHLGASMATRMDSSMSNLLDGGSTAPRMEQRSKRTSNNSNISNQGHHGNDTAPDAKIKVQIAEPPRVPRSASPVKPTEWEMQGTNQRPKAAEARPIDIPASQQHPRPASKGSQSSSKSSREGSASPNQPKSQYVPMSSPESRISSGSNVSMSERYVRSVRRQLPLTETDAGDDAAESLAGEQYINTTPNHTTPKKTSHGNLSVIPSGEEVKRSGRKKKLLSRSDDALDAYIPMSPESVIGYQNRACRMSDESSSPVRVDERTTAIYSYASPQDLSGVQKRFGKGIRGKGFSDKRKSRSTTDLMDSFAPVQSDKVGNLYEFEDAPVPWSRAGNGEDQAIEMHAFSRGEHSSLRDERETHARPPLRRLSSRSCEDVSEYARMSGEAYAEINTEVFGGAALVGHGNPHGANRNSDREQTYAYAQTPSPDVGYSLMRDPYSAEGILRRPQKATVSTDPDDLYSRPILKAMRKSVSSPNFDEDMTAAGEGQRDFKGARPKLQPFDFSNMRNNSLGNTGSAETPTPPSKKYTPPDHPERESPTRATPTTMKGVALTDRSRVFRKQNTGDGEHHLGGSPLSAGSGGSPSLDRVNGRKPALLRKPLVEQPSMHNRRLPSLPADAQIPPVSMNVPGAASYC